jgi:uncharacterized protein YcbX
MKISEINIYPVKSLKGIGLEEAKIEKRGLMSDRRWMLTDSRGAFFTQREFPKMALISVAVGADGLRFSAPGVDDLQIPNAPGISDRRQVIIWQSVCEGDVYGEDVNRWFQDVLETDCQLVHMPDTTERHVNEMFDSGDDIVSFADGYPLLLLGKASLDDLNSKLADRGSGEPLPMNRFRPNVVVTGSDAFAEDNWRRIKIGETTFRVVKPCVRCVMTTIDQAAGEFDGKEPLKTLATYRMAKNVYPETFESMGLNANGILFAQNLIPEAGGSVIRVNDPVEVLEVKDLV